MKKKEKELVNNKGRGRGETKCQWKWLWKIQWKWKRGKKGKNLSEPRGERISGRGFYQRTDLGGAPFQHEKRG